MLEWLKSTVLRLLRVPPEPMVPEGARQVRVFRASPNYFKLKLALWAVGQLGALVGLLVGLVVMANLIDEVPSRLAAMLLTGVEVAAWALFLVQLPFSYAVMRLDFEMRWYIVSDRSLRIRQGIFSVQEKTLTFANIQQISIRQNPVQRLLGIADVQVSTAGGGSSGSNPHGAATESAHEAYFRGVDNAAEIRTAIKERVRLHRDSGLGDPDEPSAPAALPAPQVLDAAVELRREMRELRRALAG